MNFRRWIIAIAMLTLFSGLASAQFTQLATINCTVTTTAPAVRSEGLTEKVGDLLISCGNATTAPTAGSAVDRGTLVVDFGTAITSRAAAAQNNVGKPSEIVLMFDEPGLNNGPVANYGQNAATSVCTAVQGQSDQAAVVAALPQGDLTAAVACPAYLKNEVNALGSYWVLDINAAGNGGQAANVYQGAIGGTFNGITGVTHTANQVKFFNVPILPSGAGNLTHLFRIANVRVNPGTTVNITATLTPTSLSVNSAPVTGSRWQYSFSPSSIQVATSGSSLSTTVTASAASLCSPTALAPAGSQAKSNLALLKFAETSAAAFKTRVLPLNNAAGDAQSNGQGAIPQTLPTGSYTIAGPISLSTVASESGVLVPALTPGGIVAGLAETGTRVKAVFAGLDANAQYWVSVSPVIDYNTPATAPVAPGVGSATATTWAVLQNAGTGGVAAADNAAYTPTAAPVSMANGAVPVVQVTRANDGTGTVVWEVTNANPAALETMTFAMYAVYDNTVAPPAIGNTATVKLGYAPQTSNNATIIPRFNAPGAAQNFFQVLPCQTSLLFPFVTNSGGYDTGIAISNTSQDPFSTATSTGTCSMNFYGTNAPAVFATPTIAPGTTYANTVSGMAAVNFSGYAVGVCNFKLAHGFAYITAPGWGGPNSASMGYLALIMNDNTTGRGFTLAGEGLGM